MRSRSDNTIQKLKEGNIIVFKEVFNQNFAFLCNYSENIVKNKNTAEDIVEEFFIRFWEKRASIRINTNLKSYMLRSVHNQSIDYLRKKAAGIEARIEEYTDLSMLKLITTFHSASEAIELNELNNKIDVAINQLPEACRRIFTMNRFEDLTYKEIASRLNVSVNTVEMQMSRALKKLRVSLKDYLQILFSIGFFS